VNRAAKRQWPYLLRAGTQGVLPGDAWEEEPGLDLLRDMFGPDELHTSLHVEVEPLPEVVDLEEVVRQTGQARRRLADLASAVEDAERTIKLGVLVKAELRALEQDVELLGLEQSAMRRVLNQLRLELRDLRDSKTELEDTLDDLRSDVGEATAARRRIGSTRRRIGSTTTRQIQKGPAPVAAPGSKTFRRVSYKR